MLGSELLWMELRSPPASFGFAIAWIAHTGLEARTRNPAGSVTIS